MTNALQIIASDPNIAPAYRDAIRPPGQFFGVLEGGFNGKPFKAFVRLPEGRRISVGRFVREADAWKAVSDRIAAIKQERAVYREREEWDERNAAEWHEGD